jgi:hypothetical protein
VSKTQKIPALKLAGGKLYAKGRSALLRDFLLGRAAQIAVLDIFIRRQFHQSIDF